MKMSNILNKINIKNTYNEVTNNETSSIKNGAKQLNGSEIKNLIKNKEVQGNFPGGFVFIARIYADGLTKGVNQYGHFDVGNWKIDFKHNLLLIEWKNGWINTSTRGYQIDNTVVFFDSLTGNWKTTFTTISEIK